MKLRLYKVHYSMLSDNYMYVAATSLEAAVDLVNKHLGEKSHIDSIEEISTELLIEERA